MFRCYVILVVLLNIYEWSFRQMKILTQEDICKHISRKDRLFYVTKNQRNDAMSILKKRICSGEDVFDILQISKKESYYVQKILSGASMLTDVLYYRIVGKLPYPERVFVNYKHLGMIYQNIINIYDNYNHEYTGGKRGYIYYE